MFPAEPDQQYFLELVNADLPELASKYEAFEAQVEMAVFALFLHGMEHGATPQGDLLRIDGVPYRLKFDAIGADRCLRLHVFPLGIPKPHLEHSVVSINHFGRVRAIDIEWPTSLLQKHESLPELLRQLVLRYYMTLRELLVSKYSQMTDSTLQSLYVVLNVHCDGEGQPVGRLWFTVTNTQTGRFRYFLDRSRVNQVTKLFIEAQFYDFSPFELVLCLLGDEAIDTFWQLRNDIDYKNTFASLPFSELKSLFSESTHWQAEKALFEESDIAVREICLCAGESLLINCPREIATDIEEIVTRAKPMLTAQFGNILKPYRAFRESVANLGGRIYKKAEHGGLRTFAAEVIAKLGKELMSPGP
jgi:hypothetical protein